VHAERLQFRLDLGSVATHGLGDALGGQKAALVADYRVGPELTGHAGPAGVVGQRELVGQIEKLLSAGEPEVLTVVDGLLEDPNRFGAYQPRG